MPPNGQGVHGLVALPPQAAPAPASSKMDCFLTSVCTPLNLQFVDVAYRVKVERTAATTAKEPPGRISHSGGGGATGVVGASVVGAVEERTILKGITGEARPGEVLAVLGPSGSGKSTLLSILGGRLPGRHTGTVLTGGRAPCRAVQRRTGFVAQDDVLHPHLTVRETLAFCAMLRLPTFAPTSAKVAAAELGWARATTPSWGTISCGVCGAAIRSACASAAEASMLSSLHGRRGPDALSAPPADAPGSIPKATNKAPASKGPWLPRWKLPARRPCQGPEPTRANADEALSRGAAPSVVEAESTPAACATTQHQTFGTRRRRRAPQRR